MQKITPSLWFDGQAEEAALLYTSIFPDGRMGRISRYGEVGQDITGQKPGAVMTVEFELAGQQFVALNGGSAFRFNEAVSFMVYCDTQEELDAYWGKLSAAPDAEQCGWLKDKYGVSWQILPSVLDEMLSDPDTTKSGPVMAALLKMKKLDIDTLVKAYGSAPAQKLGDTKDVAPATIASVPAPADAVEFGSWAKILVVEDNEDLAEIYKAKMEMIGYICFVAHEGTEALAMIEKERPSLVLLDLMVPGIAGDQILKRMRASAWGKDIKVLVISNLNEEDAPAGLRQEGIEGYAVKANLTDDQLDQMVNKILEHSGQKPPVSS